MERQNSVNKKKRILCAVICIALVCCLAAGGYAGNMFGYFNKGNARKYAAANCERVDSPLEGKTVVFLGSSVTYGFASKGESFVEYLAARDGIVPIKEAKSGTTLVDDSADSYISRMKTLGKDISADIFVCQLSTNDATQDKPLGEIADGFEINSFDTHTVAGAIEYIIAYAKETWNCPVVFYTNPQYDSGNYAKMVALLVGIADKWEISVIDLWNDAGINAVSDEMRAVYMNDSIHPTRLGYLEWWLPVFEDALSKTVS